MGRFDVVEHGDEVILSLPDDNARMEPDIVENEIAMVVVDPIT